MTTPPIEIQFAQELYPMQHDAVFPVCGARWVCVEASTKSGLVPTITESSMALKLINGL